MLVTNPVKDFFNKNIFRIILTIFTFVFIFSCGTSNFGAPSDTEITLVIKNPDALFNQPNYNRGLIKSSCKIKDNRTNPLEQDPYQIISIVDPVKNVIWKIEVENDPTDQYKEAIEFIEKKDNTSSQRNQLPFFKAKILRGNGAEAQGLTNNNAKPRKKYTYSIVFSLSKGGVTYYYSIDPELKGNN